VITSSLSTEPLKSSTALPDYTGCVQ
jgi:hypothetical protein